MSIAVMVFFWGRKGMIGRMSSMCSGFSMEKGKWPKDNMRNMYLKE
jgi:hypothetical protein